MDEEDFRASCTSPVLLSNRLPLKIHSMRPYSFLARTRVKLVLFAFFSCIPYPSVTSITQQVSGSCRKCDVHSMRMATGHRSVVAENKVRPVPA